MITIERWTWIIYRRTLRVFIEKKKNEENYHVCFITIYVDKTV
jgi:hypothetical protein